MIRAQIYLTETEKNQLHMLAHHIGKSQSELIREAIDQFIARNQEKTQDKLNAIRSIKGIWKDREDLPDFSKLRNEFDARGFSKEGDHE